MRILVVDDDEIFRNLVKKVLLDENYEVITAENGLKGFEVIERENGNIDLAILDVNMPEMDGFELLSKIRSDKRFAHIPVLMLTIREFTEDQIAGYEYGADDYIPKPFDTNILIARIKVLERRIINQRKKAS